MKEMWKDIKGYNGDYQVSNAGRVRSNKYGYWKILKQYKCGKGYIGIDLCKNGQYGKFLMHRLVASHLIPNPLSLPEVNHKDGDKFNNNKANLNWTDGKGNMKHAREVLGFNMNGERSPNSKLSEAEVKEIISLYNLREISVTEIARKYNICNSHVWALSKGIYWKYLNNNII